MLDHLRRLATTGIAYSAASVFSKIVAVILLPIYTVLVPPDEYGKVELLFGLVVAISIIARFGVIEAILRFYFLPDEDKEEVVRSGFASIFWVTTAFTAILFPFAEPISDALKSDPGLVRIAIGGLWTLTLYEYLLTLYRLDERAREYFFFTFANVLATIPVTLVLLTVFDQDALGILVGSYATGVVFVLWLAWKERARLGLRWESGVTGRMFRFGLPTMPAEVSLYGLVLVDRIVLVQYLGPVAVGLYSISVKCSQALQVLIRGFQLAWPPLAYSITDDEEAKRIYATVMTIFTAISAFAVVGLWLEARWIVRILADDQYFGAYEAVGLLSLGAALYGVYLTQLVILGRTGRTEFNLPATAAALGLNLVLNLILVPDHGIVGAGIASAVSYAAAVALMYVFTQRLFPVPWQWGRLAVIAGSAALMIAAGDMLLPTDGAVSLLSRTALWLAYPVVLWFGGAISPEERAVVRRLANREELSRRLAEFQERRAAGDAPPGEELIEAEMRDEDRGLGS